MAAVICLALGIFLNVVSLVTNAITLLTGSVADPTSEEIALSDLLDIGLGLLQLIVIFATIVLFSMWLYRAASNLEALGHPKHLREHSPGWAVGSFFVPFVNLVVPYRAVKEVWAKSDPEEVGEEGGAPFGYYSAASTPAYFKAWWGFWLVSNMVNNVATRLYFNVDTQDEMVWAMKVDTIGTLLTIPAAVFAILVVKSIDRRQQERSRRIRYIPNLPPPPPVFDNPQQTTTQSGWPR